MSHLPPTRILVIDEIPLIAAGLRETLRSIQPAIHIEYCDNIFTALSNRRFAGTSFDLVVIDSLRIDHNTPLLQAVSEVKQAFGQPQIMIYTAAYDPLIIQTMSDTGIDAYVHKHESTDEILRTYQHLSLGQPYISGMFHTLYFEYGFGAGK
jgi:DNA-binding NarL/FixJ family response regulator